MSDTSYNIEVKPASKNGWFTAAEAKAYYGRFGRDGYCVHWWGGGETADKHDSIVNYLLGQASAGIKSANYVLSDNKIDLLVGPDSVAWCQESGNATEISVETQPTLTDEGYKKHGWLKNQLDQRYNKTLTIHGHNFWFATSCPGTISLDRIAQEADKWSRGVYDAIVVPPVVVPDPPAPNVPSLTPISTVVMYTLADAKLVNIKTLKVIKMYPLDTPIEVSATITYNNQNFWISTYSKDHNTGQGFLQGDLKATTTPVVVPEPDKPDWVKNLRDIDDTQYWLSIDQPLMDITKDTPVIPAKVLKKDDTFIASAVTVAGGIEYRITDYSFKRNVFNGIPTDSLTLTAPGVPDIDPIEEPTVPQGPVVTTPPTTNTGGITVGGFSIQTISKALAGVVAGFIVSFLMKHNLVISDNLPDVIENLISAVVTGLIVFVAPKNKDVTK